MLDNLAAVSAAALASIWIGYPALIGVLSVVRTRHRPRGHSVLPTVTVVMATRAPCDDVDARVANLLETDYPLNLLQVIVARDYSATPIGAPAKSRPQVEYISGDAPGGKPAALNAALREASGEIVVFCDTYQRFSSETIGKLVERFGDERVAAVSGRLELGNSGGATVRTYWRIERWLRSREARLHSCVGLSGCVCAIRRKLWIPLSVSLLCDDLFIPMRLILQGHRIDFADGAHAFELRDPSPPQEYERKLRTLTGVLQVCAWLPALLMPFRNPVWIQFIGHKLLRLLTPYFLLIIALWAGSSAVDAMMNTRTLPLMIAAVAAICLLGRKGLFVRARRMATELALLQAAAVMAAVNALRGHWHVWGN